MTDKINGFTVTLEKDYRIDDVEVILNALRMIKGVIHVEPLVSDMDDHISQERLKHELRGKFLAFMKENLT